MYSGKNTFTWSLQLAGYDHKHLDQKGIIDLQGFMQEFEKFSWIEQAIDYQELQKGCSATLSIKDQQNDHTLWISSYLNVKDHIFILGFIYPVKPKVFLGINWQNKKYIHEGFETQGINKVKSYIELFFKREYKTILSKMKVENTNSEPSNS